MYILRQRATYLVAVQQVPLFIYFSKTDIAKWEIYGNASSDNEWGCYLDDQVNMTRVLSNCEPTSISIEATPA